MSTDEKFEVIATDVSREAAGVQCSKEEYIGGLRMIIEALQIDIDAAKEF